MIVAEARIIISNINKCKNAMSILQKNEKNSYYKDCFKMNEELLEQYKVLLEEKIEKAEL